MQIRKLYTSKCLQGLPVDGRWFISLVFDLQIFYTEFLTEWNNQLMFKRLVRTDILCSCQVHKCLSRPWLSVRMTSGPVWTRDSTWGKVKGQAAWDRALGVHSALSWLLLKEFLGEMQKRFYSLVLLNIYLFTVQNIYTMTAIVWPFCLAWQICSRAWSLLKF